MPDKFACSVCQVRNPLGRNAMEIICSLCPRRIADAILENGGNSQETLKLKSKLESEKRKLTEEFLRMEEVSQHSSMVKALTARGLEGVVLVCGEAREPVNSIKSVLAYFSQFFEIALYGGYAEGSKKEISLPDDNPQVIKLMVNWMLTGLITNDDIKELDKDEGHYIEDLLADAWVTGDKYLCPGFCNAVMKCWLRVFHDSGMILPPTLRFVFENTLLESKLREAVVDVIKIIAPLGREYDDPQQRAQWLQYVVDATTDAEKESLKACLDAGGFHTMGSLAHLIKSCRMPKYMMDVNLVLVAKWREHRAA